MLHGWTPEEMERIKAKYATKGNVLEAVKLIEAKARDMLRHYVENILPNGFKAQVVAVSRRAAIRYFDALTKAQDDLVKQVCSAIRSARQLGATERFRRSSARSTRPTPGLAHFLCRWAR